MSHNILITGATGQQGGAVISSLSSLDNTPFTIYALTRDVTSPSALKLASRYPSVRLVAGTYDDPNAIFSACKAPISSIFAVQGPSRHPEIEERNGKELIDAAILHGVKVYVQTSVDRGINSDINPTKIPHFEAKYNIEKYLQVKAGATNGKMSFTILRPTSFMENLADGFISKVTATSWRDVLPADQKVQLIAVSDIGWFAAQALFHPADKHYMNKSISLAGDELSYAELAKTWEDVAGRAIPTTYGPVRWLLFQLIAELRLTFEFMSDEGFAADIEGLRLVNGNLLTFKMWLEQGIALRTLKNGI